MITFFSFVHKNFFFFYQYLFLFLVKWSFNNKIIRNNDSILLNADNNKYILSISNTTLLNKGKYTFEAVNKFGKVLVDFDVNVLSNVRFSFKDFLFI